jgi:acid phosphatase
LPRERPNDVLVIYLPANSIEADFCLGNETTEMEYLNNLISKWMPHGSPRVAVDSHPRLSGIMDTINSTLAHGTPTRLPSEFYDPKARAIIDKIGVEEWFSGYKENREYRTLGIGGLMGDVLERMTESVEGSGKTGIAEVGGENGELETGRGGEKEIRFALSGCHDTTLAAMLTSLGAFEGEKWPPYTSHIAIELFRKKDATSPARIIPPDPRDQPDQVDQTPVSRTPSDPSPESSPKPGFFSSMFSRSPSPSLPSSTIASSSVSAPIGRTTTSLLSTSQLSKLNDYYVRIRYNDRTMVVPACKQPGKNLNGDETFCTLRAFKEVVDDFVPANWKRQCQMNLESKENVFRDEKAGY